MKTSTKIVLGVFASVVCLWLAGSAYFLANGDDVAPREVVVTDVPPLAPEENAYYHFKELQGLCQTNFNFTVANDYLNGWTNGPAVQAEVEALVAAHSNLYNCVRKILNCRGFQYPKDVRIADKVPVIFNHAAARLLLVKAHCEAMRGDRRSAQASIEELIALGRCVRRTLSVVGYLVGAGYEGMAIYCGGRAPVAAPEDVEWRNRLIRVLEEEDRESVPVLSAAAVSELAGVRQELMDIRTNAVRRDSLILQNGLDGFAWLTRNNRKGGIVSFRMDGIVRVDWARVDRSCQSSVLACCLGYSDYVFKPGMTYNAVADARDEFVRKLRAPSFDREYAGPWSRSVDADSPLRENQVGFAVAEGSWNLRPSYKTHCRSLFGNRTSRLRLACETYRAKHGCYPAVLADLVPEVLSSIPTDPYDGQPIRYDAEGAYFWTPGPDGDYDGRVKFNPDGYPRWKNGECKFVQFIDMSRAQRPPMRYR